MTEFDARKFAEESRVHVEHGSLFYDRFVQVHPRELAPENESRLIQKLDRIWQQDAPSFFGTYPRGMVAQLFGGLVPISAKARKEVLSEQNDAADFFAKHGVDEAYKHEWESRRNPFASLVSGDATKPEIPAAAKEFLSNGMQLYLLLDEALNQKGYPKELIFYLKRGGSMESLLSDLEDKIGMSPHRLMDIAQTQGAAGVGRALGLSEDFIGNVAEVTAIASHAHFSDNIIQHWQIGRRIAPNASTADQVQAGRLPRIAYAVQSMREQVGFNYDVPAGIKEKEYRVAAALNRLPSVMREALFELGAEFAYTPEVTVEPISPGAGAYGYHMKLIREPGDVDGVYQVFLAQKESNQSFARLVAHEVHHLFFPQRFGKDEITQVDTLANAHFARITDLKLLCDAYKIGTPKQREAIEWKINTDYAVDGVGLKQALGGRTMEQFCDLVLDAYENTNIHSNFFSKTSYNSAPEKFYEMISRYAELRCVELEDNPKLLNFIAPELTQIYDQHYLPHVQAQLNELKGRAPQADASLRLPRDTNMMVVPAMLDAAASAPATHVRADSIRLDEPSIVNAPAGVDAAIHVAGSHEHGQSFADRVTQSYTADAGITHQH